MFRMITYWWPRMKFSRHVVSRAIVLFCLKKKKKKARMVWSEACEFKRHDVNIQESRVFSFFLFMFVYDITFSRNLTTNNLHHKLVCWQAPCEVRVARAERGEKKKDHPAKWAKQTLTQTFRVLRHDSGEFTRKLITCQNRDYEAVVTLTQLEDRKRRQNWAPICASGPSLSSVPERNVFFFLTRVFIKYLKCWKKYSFGVWILEFRLIQCLLRFNYSFTFRRSTSVIFPRMSEESFSLSDALSFSFDKQIKNGRTRRK